MVSFRRIFVFFFKPQNTNQPPSPGILYKYDYNSIQDQRILGRPLGEPPSGYAPGVHALSSESQKKHATTSLQGLSLVLILDPRPSIFRGTSIAFFQTTAYYRRRVRKTVERYHVLRHRSIFHGIVSIRIIHFLPWFLSLKTRPDLVARCLFRLLRMKNNPNSHRMDYVISVTSFEFPNSTDTLRIYATPSGNLYVLLNSPINSFGSRSTPFLETIPRRSAVFEGGGRGLSASMTAVVGGCAVDAQPLARLFGSFVFP